MGELSRIDVFASRQYGCFNIDQAREAGFDRSAVHRRVSKGRWLRLSPRVYAVASAPPTWERQMAAAILNLERARVAAESAAYLHGLKGWTSGRPVVMVPAGGNARSSMSRIIRSRYYDEIAHNRVRGFETTSAAETLFTLAATVPRAKLGTTLDESLLTGKATLGEYEAIFTRVVGGRVRGAAVLRGLIEERHPDAYGVSSTYLERMMERVLSDPRIPPSTREYPMRLNGRDSRTDAFIVDWGLVVEADSRRWHTRVGDFEADRARDNALLAQGLRVVRLTYQMLKDDPEGCIETILAAGRHQ